MIIRCASEKDYGRLIEIWESSVRATHDFVAERDLLDMKPLVLSYFPHVDLSIAVCDRGDSVGFCGVSSSNIEMLFVTPEARGKGVGALLAQYAIREQKVTHVDVNEQNTQARGFYEHLGFVVVGRSPLDAQGRAYPLLHMQLNNYNGDAI